MIGAAEVRLARSSAAVAVVGGLYLLAGTAYLEVGWPALVAQALAALWSWEVARRRNRRAAGSRAQLDHAPPVVSFVAVVVAVASSGAAAVIPWYLTVASAPMSWGWPVAAAVLLAILSAGAVRGIRKGATSHGLDRLRSVVSWGGAWLLACTSYSIATPDPPMPRWLPYTGWLVGCATILAVVALDLRSRRILRVAFRGLDPRWSIGGDPDKYGPGLPHLIGAAPGGAVLLHRQRSGARGPYRNADVPEPVGMVPPSLQDALVPARYRGLATAAMLPVLVLLLIGGAPAPAQQEDFPPDHLALPASCQPPTRGDLLLAPVRASREQPAAVDMAALAARYRRAYGLPVRVAAPMEVPPSLLSRSGSMWRARASGLNDLLAHTLAEDGEAAAILGVTDIDLIPQVRGWHWAFGQSGPGPVGVVSIVRMRYGGAHHVPARLHKMLTRYVGRLWCRVGHNPYPGSVMRMGLGSVDGLDAMDERVW